MQNYISKFKILTFAILLLIFAFLFLNLSEAKAHCPLCVAGAGAGLTLTRWVGVDDAITGVWIAAILGATALWTQTLIKKRFSNLKDSYNLLQPLVYISIFALTLASFYQFNLVGTHGDIFGLHKLTFGIIAGGIIFYLVDIFDDYLIKRNGKVFFPYQRIIVSLGSMLVLSLGIYVLINYYI